MILLEVNPADGRPIYGQIADRVRFAVAAGVLRPGDLVPSVREVSKQLVVNPNTVARAYRELQGEGLLDTGPGDRVAGGRGGGRAVQAGAERVRPRPAPRRPSRRRGRPSSIRPRSRRSCARSGPGGTVPPTRRTGGTGDDEPGETRDPDREPDQALPRPGRTRWALAGGPRGLGLRPPGRERGGQDHDLADLAGADRRRTRGRRRCSAWIPRGRGSRSAAAWATCRSSPRSTTG